jgi:hypothetical protein
MVNSFPTRFDAPAAAKASAAVSALHLDANAVDCLSGSVEYPSTQAVK